jgi:hypothetical protein
MDELEEKLRRRDRRFLLRVTLSMAVTLLGGIWGLLALEEANFGGCAARGFDALTSPAGASTGSPSD